MSLIHKTKPYWTMKMHSGVHGTVYRGFWRSNKGETAKWTKGLYKTRAFANESAREHIDLEVAGVKLPTPTHSEEAR